MRLADEIAPVHELHAGGLNNSQIARLTGVSRATVREWIRTQRPAYRACSVCGHAAHSFDELPPREYAYLLGIYLGDGTISRTRRGVSRLRIVQDIRYPGIIKEIATAVACVMPANRVHVYECARGHKMAEISSVLEVVAVPLSAGGARSQARAQDRADGVAVGLRLAGAGAVRPGPDSFRRLPGHEPGDAAEVLYPRYMFSNESLDIQQLFRDACDLIGVEYRNNRPNSISVAKRASVARLDEIVGPKT